MIAFTNVTKQYGDRFFCRCVLFRSIPVNGSVWSAQTEPENHDFPSDHGSRTANDGSVERLRKLTLGYFNQTSQECATHRFGRDGGRAGEVSTLGEEMKASKNRWRKAATI